MYTNSVFMSIFYLSSLIYGLGVDKKVIMRISKDNRFNGIALYIDTPNLLLRGNFITGGELQQNIIFKINFHKIPGSIIKDPFSMTYNAL